MGGATHSLSGSLTAHLLPRGVALRLAAAIAAILLAALITSVAALAQTVANNDYANRTQIAVGGEGMSPTSNVFANNEPQEPLTSNDPNQQRCTAEGAAGPTGARFNNTTWWEFEGTGGTVEISTSGSSPVFDTVLAV